ncbi:MAG: O-acetylhomoserine aminocarboxypropyltransferase/cysteine synthase [Parcubacteria group bacterium]|nr:O-acetylhomoserine aminocarboxypropyltransferase/cysteine synthase [Parcubacteria group bacterium]
MSRKEQQDMNTCRQEVFPTTRKVLEQRGFHDWRNNEFHSLVPPEQGLAGPVYTSIAYAFNTAQEAAEIFSGERSGYAYPRISRGSPTVNVLAQKLVELELGDGQLTSEYDAILTASGMSAITLVALAFADRGRSIVSSPYLYGGTYHLFEEFLPRLGIECIMIDDPCNLDSWRKGIAQAKHPALLYAEDDANPMLIKLDNEAIGELAHAHGLLYVCDRTIGTPLLEKPLLAGTDMVVHSLSKNISGHSWALGGAIIGRKTLIAQIRESYFPVMGPVMDARVADCILKGLESFPKRMRQKIGNAKRIASTVRRHPKVKRVYGPGGDLFAFEIEGTLEDAKRVIESLKLVVFAPHLGDIQTLAIHPASTTHAKIPKEEREKLGITDTLIRISVGLESVYDVCYDIYAALGN